MEIKKPYAVFQYNEFMKGINRGRPVPQFLLSSVKNCKMVKEVVLYLLKCVLFNAFLVYRTLNTNKIKYKNLLHEVGRSWISEVHNGSESSSDDLQLPEMQTTPKGPKQDPPGRLSSDFRIHKHEKLFAGGGEKQDVFWKTV
jgi:hypothetical protein